MLTAPLIFHLPFIPAIFSDSKIIQAGSPSEEAGTTVSLNPYNTGKLNETVTSLQCAEIYGSQNFSLVYSYLPLKVA